MTTDLVALVIDEQITGRRTLRNRLGRMGFQEVLESPDDRKAWEVLRTREAGVDLIVSTNEDTVDFVQRVRRDGRLRAVPFLVVSEHADGSTVLEAIRAGVTRYLVKPFTQETFEAQVERALGRPVRPVEAPARSGR